MYCLFFLTPLFSLFLGCEDKTQDVDGDGWFADEDCDDSNPDVYPNAQGYCDDLDINSVSIEECDGEDNNCDRCCCSLSFVNDVE